MKFARVSKAAATRFAAAVMFVGVAAGCTGSADAPIGVYGSFKGPDGLVHSFYAHLSAPYDTGGVPPTVPSPPSTTSVSGNANAWLSDGYDMCYPTGASGQMSVNLDLTGAVVDLSTGYGTLHASFAGQPAGPSTISVPVPPACLSSDTYALTPHPVVGNTAVVTWYLTDAKGRKILSGTSPGLIGASYEYGTAPSPTATP